MHDRNISHRPSFHIQRWTQGCRVRLFKFVNEMNAAAEKLGMHMTVSLLDQLGAYST